MNVTTRAATDADKTFARDAHHLACHDVVVRQFGKWDEAVQDRFFERNWSSNHLNIILADGVPSGWRGMLRPNAAPRLKEE